jgi:hypothetical protein
MITNEDLSDGRTVACLPLHQVEDVAKAVYYATKTLKKILARVPPAP